MPLLDAIIEKVSIRFFEQSMFNYINFLLEHSPDRLRKDDQ